MSIDGTMALLYAQTGMAAPLAHNAAVAPQAAHAMTSLLAQETAQQERQQVQKADKTDGASVGEREGRGGQSFSSGRRAPSHDAEEEKAVEQDAPEQTSPLVGNLLNIKV